MSTGVFPDQFKTVLYIHFSKNPTLTKKTYPITGQYLTYLTDRPTHRKGPKRTEKGPKRTEKGTEKDRKGRTSLLFTEKEAKSRR